MALTSRLACLSMAAVTLVVSTGCGSGSSTDRAGDPAAATAPMAAVDPCPSPDPSPGSATGTADPTGSPVFPLPDVDLPEGTFSCLGPGPDVAWPGLVGQPRLINLWASWCAPCREEMPLLQATYRAQQDAGVETAVDVVGVDTQDGASAAVDFLAAIGATYPQVEDREGVMLDHLGLPGLPVTLGIDAHGRVVDVQVGQLTAQRLAEMVTSVGGSAPD